MVETSQSAGRLLAPALEEEIRRLRFRDPELEQAFRTDYAAKGLPYSWPLEGGTDPETGGILVAHNFTAMPSLRLSDQDARDIATYLVSLKTDKEYADVPWMTDASPELLRKQIDRDIAP